MFTVSPIHRAVSSLWLQLDEDEDDEDLDASQDVEAVAYFIGNEKNEFPAGSEATALILFDNQGTGPFQIRTIEGSFRHPQEFRYFLQNFSIDVANVTVPAGEQVRFTQTHAALTCCFFFSCATPTLCFGCAHQCVSHHTPNAMPTDDICLQVHAVGPV